MLVLSIVAFVVLMLAWILVGLWPSWGIEEPQYEVIKKTEVYEIRNYKPYVLAQTRVSGSYQEAISQGFRIIAGYIFGDNVSKQKISMTAPVIQERASEKIAMTAPVVATGAGSGVFDVSFIMPNRYTLDSLPKPNDSRISFVEVPAHRVAVLSFGWYATSNRVAEQTELLRQALEKDSVHVLRFESARYNPPWTPPFLMRNEIWAILDQ